MPTLTVALIMAVSFRAGAVVNRELPVANLAKQIADIAGPGPAKLTIRNQSSLNAEEIPAIRALLEHDLRGYGVLVTGADTATSIRLTLSENAAGGLWVAEVHEGTEVRVTMVSADLGKTAVTQIGAAITLRKALLWEQKDQVLDVLMLKSVTVPRMVVLEPERLVSYAMTAGSWKKEREFTVTHSRPFPRDMRGRLLVGQGDLFDAYLPGVQCSGTAGDSDGSLAVSCSDSDDPWPLPGITTPLGGAQVGQKVQQKAFYNSSRDYFTGLLAPGFGIQIPPFYAAAMIPRPNGAAILFNGIDGKVVMIENNMMKPIAGARDWGSDLISIRSGCGSGTQVLVSGSGAMSIDSVRAYEIPAREAEPVSAPLALDGSVTAIWPSGDDGVATVMVRTTAGPAQGESYEVYSVSTLCN
jgi:hypothetical protein